MKDNLSILSASLIDIIGGNLPVRISSRPESIPVDLRKAWRIAVIILILSYCRSKRARREKLLLLNHALQNPSTHKDLIEIFEGSKSPFFLQIRVDPAFARALDFAIGLGLLQQTNPSSVTLSNSGNAMADAINSDSSIFFAEKQFLAQVAKFATEARVQSILEWR